MDPIDTYWANGFPHVQGWVHGRLLDVLKLVDATQRGAGISGEGAEIGVFHGKLFIALASMLEPGGKMTALDVFDDQDKNIDGAGEGSLAQTQANVAAYGRTDIDYHYIKADSTALTIADRVGLVTTRGPIRLFSIDGCHTTQHTLSNLRTAEDCIAPGGVVILDDYMQPHWPGVTEATGIYFAGVPRVAPFLYAYHKLFMVGLGWHAHFLRAAEEALAGHPDLRRTTMFGNGVASIFP